MKRKRILFFGLLLAVLVAALVLNTPERRALRWYDRHSAAQAQAIESGNIQTEPRTPFAVMPAVWDGAHPIVEYVVVSGGIVPASRYYGVFYSYDGTPVSFSNSGETLMSDGEDAWRWQGQGDNRGLVRRLDAHWFYFEAFL